MNPSPAGPQSSRALTIVCLLAAVFAMSQLTRSWDASLLDRYEFRQLQTALSSYWIADTGLSLAYPTPLFGPPWSIPMEFPTYQVIVAGLHITTGWPLEQAGRLISMLMLLACLPALHDLLALARLPHSRRLIVHAFVLTAPVYLFYARTFMIETTALCLCVWFLALLRRALAQSSPWWIVATTTTAVLAALTKITTFVVFGLPAAALCLAAWRQAGPDISRRRLALAALVPALLSLGIAWWWVRFGDAVKDSNPFSGFLTARELHNWNFGTWSLRADWSFWLHLQETIASHNLAEGAMAIALLCVPFASIRARWIAGTALLGFISGPLIFANLYHLHDYYYAANALLLLSSAGIVVASAWDNPRLPRGTNWLALTLIFAFQGYAFYRGYDSHHRNPAPPPPAFAAQIKSAVPPDGVVLIYGADWNPLLPYYIQRRVIMVPGERENETEVLEQVIARLSPPQHGIDAMIVHGAKLRADTRFIRERTTRFGLSPQSAGSDADNTLYLTTDLGADFQGLQPSKAMGNFPSDLAPTTLPVDTEILFHPQPVAVQSRYGLSVAKLGEQTILNAHAPSELAFMVPAGARELVATAGLPDAAFAPDQTAVSDGITIEILQEFPNGSQRFLYQRYLDPAHEPNDRGPQLIRISLPQPFTGRLLLRLGNGPAGNPTNDWAYWLSVGIN